MLVFPRFPLYWRRSRDKFLVHGSLQAVHSLRRTYQEVDSWQALVRNDVLNICRLLKFHGILDYQVSNLYEIYRMAINACSKTLTDKPKFAKYSMSKFVQWSLRRTGLYTKGQSSFQVLGRSQITQLYFPAIWYLVFFAKAANNGILLHLGRVGQNLTELRLKTIVSRLEVENCENHETRKGGLPLDARRLAQSNTLQFYPLPPPPPRRFLKLPDFFSQFPFPLEVSHWYFLGVIILWNAWCHFLPW